MKFGGIGLLRRVRTNVLRKLDLLEIASLKGL